MDPNLSLSLWIIAAGLLLGMAWGLWRIRRNRRAAWSLIESCSSAVEAPPPAVPPGASGPLEVGDERIRKVTVTVVERGLLLWRNPNRTRLLEWSAIQRLLPLATTAGEVRGVTVELADRRWGPDRFSAPWSARLSEELLARGHARLAGP